MYLKAISIFFISIPFLYANEMENFNKEVEQVNNNKTEFTESVQLMSKEEKARMIREHMAKIEAERKRISELMEKGKTLQGNIQVKIEENEEKRKIEEEKVKAYKEQLASIQENLKEVQDRMEKQKNEKSMVKPLLNSKIPLLKRKGAKEVVFSLGNGKTINLIEHTVQNNDILSSIISQTFPSKPKWVEIEERIKVVIKMNKNIKNQDMLVAGSKIYIPYFK